MNEIQAEKMINVMKRIADELHEQNILNKKMLITTNSSIEAQNRRDKVYNLITLYSYGKISENELIDYITKLVKGCDICQSHFFWFCEIFTAVISIAVIIPLIFVVIEMDKEKDRFDKLQ